MSSPETYTLTDLARFCGVSRQAVYKRLRTDEQLRTEVDTHTVNTDAATCTSGGSAAQADTLSANFQPDSQERHPA